MDGVVVEKGIVWHDQDQDGEVDNNEPPIKGVIGEIYYEESLSDTQSIAEVTDFLPGCSCNCWKSESIYIEVLEGYYPTTPVSYKLTGKDLMYKPGLKSYFSEE